MEAEGEFVDSDLWPPSNHDDEHVADAWDGGVADAGGDVEDLEELPLAYQEVVLEGMPGFEDFYEDSIDDEDAISWVDDDLSINWEGMQDELFGEDFTDIGNGDDSGISTFSSSAESDEKEEPTFEGPNLVSPEGYAIFNVQTSSFHRQVADAICCSGNQAPPGYQEVVKFHQNTIQILRIPDNSDEEVIVVFEEDIRAKNQVHQYRIKPFSITRSEDGQYLSVATGDGLIFLMELSATTRCSPASSCGENGSSAAGVDNNITTYEQSRMFIFALTTVPELVNSVRFGRIGGKTRLMVGCQDKYILFFEVPSESERTPVVASLCQGQEGLSLDADEVDSKEVVSVARDFASTSSTVTAAVGDFLKAINFVISSNDGRWIAVCGDFDHVVLLDEKKRYRLSQAKSLHYQPGTVLETHSKGSQYCSFNTSGDVVVATSDHIFGVFVWKTDSGDLLFHVGTHFPCLAVTFFDNFVCAFHETEKRVHIIDLRYFPQGHQIIKLPKMRLDSFASLLLSPKQITGLASVNNKLFIATPTNTLSLEYVQGKPWSRKSHKIHPDAFKLAMRSLILGAAADTDSKVYSLPQATIEQIISCSAHPIGDWLLPSQERV